MKGLLKGKYSKHFTGITTFIKLYSLSASGKQYSFGASGPIRNATLPPHSYVHAHMNT